MHPRRKRILIGAALGVILTVGALALLLRGRPLMAAIRAQAIPA